MFQKKYLGPAYFNRWHNAVSSGSSLSASDDFDLLPFDISLDFLYRDIDVHYFLFIISSCN